MRAFDLAEAGQFLSRTPTVLRTWLAGLPEPWPTLDDGAETWSPFDVVGHLIHGEKTDWIPRVEHILHGDPTVPFEPFDRSAMFEASRGKSLADLLEEFERLRSENLARLVACEIAEEDLDRPGLHPALGAVDLRQLLASWVVHDLGHLAQIARVMARQYREEVGPWRAYLTVLDVPAKP